MFDGHEMRTPGLVVVSGARIFAVGPGAATPAGAQVIDFGDATLSPGFIDAHTHLSYQTEKVLFVMKDGVVYRDDGRNDAARR